MKPAWDTLMNDFKDSKTALVGDVDCTVEEELCGKHNVEGYPTIKWGKMDDLKDYDGGRELSELREWANSNLGPKCGPKSLDECDETEKKLISEALPLSDADLEAKLKEAKAKVTTVEKDYDDQVDKLSKQIDELEKKKDEAVGAIKKEGLSSWQMVWDDRHPPPPPPPAEDDEGGDEDFDDDQGEGDEPEDDEPEGDEPKDDL